MMKKPTERVDAIVVGAGAAGGVYADVLAKAGKRVVILESGPAWTQQDLVSSQLWARRLKWRGTPVMLAGTHPPGYNANYGSGTGGAALHHYGTWPRIPPEAFEMQSRYGVGHDWGISYEELRPWYDRVQREVGISGDREREGWSEQGDSPYPMPGLPTLQQGAVLDRGFKKLGKQTAPLPAIIKTEPYNGKPPCIYDGWCDAGCPIGALGNPLENYLAAGIERGAVLRNHAVVTRVLTDGDGRASGVEYHYEGQRRELHADVVVLAASVVQNPRLLLNSATERSPTGLANSSGLVGHYFESEVMVGAYGLFEEDTQPYLGVNCGQLMYRERPVQPHRKDLFGGYQWQIAPAMKPNDLFGVAMTRPDLFGDRLTDFIERGSHHIANMVAFGGTWAQRDNRVELAEVSDGFGMPAARVVHSFSEQTNQLWAYLKREGEAIMAAAGAKEAWTTPAPLTGHTNGGTIMGADPEASVTDTHGRCHDIGNLVLSGAGIIPSGAGTSPTFTIHALALRSAEFLVENWSDVA